MANETTSTCTLCATVITGFESVTVSECKQKLHCNPVRKRGKVYFEIPVNLVHKARELRSVENLFVVVKDIEDFRISNNNDEDKEMVLERLYQLAYELEWNEALSVWQNCTGYQGRLQWQLTNQSRQSNNGDDNDDNSTNQSTNVSKIEESTISDTIPSFRVTATRGGTGHQFSSVEAAAKFGGSVNDLFHWRVDLSNADIEVLLYIADDNVVVGLALTRKSLGKRNIQHFGPTTLKSSLAYCLLHLAEIKSGEFWPFVIISQKPSLPRSCF